LTNLKLEPFKPDDKPGCSLRNPYIKQLQLLIEGTSTNIHSLNMYMKKESKKEEYYYERVTLKKGDILENYESVINDLILKFAVKISNESTPSITRFKIEGFNFMKAIDELCSNIKPAV